MATSIPPEPQPPQLFPPSASESCGVVPEPVYHSAVATLNEQKTEQGYDARLLKTVSDLEEVRQFWMGLQLHPNTNFEFFRLLLEARPGVLRPNVLVLSRREIPQALVLGRLEQARVPVKLGYLTLWKPLIRSLVVLHEGFLGDNREEAAVAALRVLMDELASGEADRIYLSNQRTDSALSFAARTLPSALSRDLGISETIHRSMKVPDEPGEFLRRMKSKHRSWIKAKARELEACFPGSVQYAMFSGVAELPKATADIEEIARKTYHRGLGVGFKRDGEHLRRFELEAKAGGLRICILYAGGAPRAYWIGFRYADTFHSAFTGYDPDLRNHELGTLVFTYLVDRLSEEKVATFDFGLGDAFYKQRFADLSWTEASLSVYRPCLRGISLNVGLSLCHHLARFLRTAAQRLKVLERLKRAWRSKLAPAKSASS